MDSCQYNLLCVYVISISIAEVDCKCNLTVGVDSAAWAGCDAMPDGEGGHGVAKPQAVVHVRG